MQDTTSKSERRERRLIDKPEWLSRFEQRLASKIRVHPNLLSATKLLLAPLLLLALRQLALLPGGPALVVSLFIAFGLLDYLDGVVARGRGLETSFGRVFDRVTDYPLLIGLSYFCLDVLPAALVVTKIVIDLLLLALYLAGRGSTQNRLRTAMSYTTLLALLALSQGWLPQLIKPVAVTSLLIANISFSAIVALYNLDVLQKRFIADGLSLANLLCGAVSMWLSSRGLFPLALLMMLCGATFDGFDGAAARRWGGTRWGVYSDDVADAVNFAIAPAVALYFAIGGYQGALIGTVFAAFTVGRLVFFTLNKDSADPDYFNGAPSPVGAFITMCAIILFGDHTALVGLLVGVACAQMVGFDSAHRHLGRALAKHRRKLLLGLPALLTVFAIAGALWGAIGATAVLLTLCLGYALLPIARSFVEVAKSYGQAGT